MKVLFLTFRYPLPEIGGDYLRINAIANYFKGKGYEVVLFSLFNPKESDLKACNSFYDKVYIQRRYSLFSNLYTIVSFFLLLPLQLGYFFSFRYLFKLRSLLKEEKPDLVVAHTIRAAQYLSFLKYNHNCILEATDALSKTYLQFYQAFNPLHFNLKQFLYSIEYKRVHRCEQKYISFFRKTVFVSKDDIAFLGDPSNCFSYPNGVSLANSYKEALPNKIVFVGNLRSLQNEDAVLFFSEKIFPLILHSIPDARFYIVGANPSEKVLSLQSNNIIVTGYVPDLISSISDAALSVAPIRYAAGIQNKVLVSMAQKIPVVLTSAVSKGIPQLSNGFNCFIKDSPEDFADACIQCLTNKSKAAFIAENAYTLVKDNYSWSAALNNYESLHS